MFESTEDLSLTLTLQSVDFRESGEVIDDGQRVLRPSVSSDVSLKRLAQVHVHELEGSGCPAEGMVAWYGVLEVTDSAAVAIEVRTRNAE